MALATDFTPPNLSLRNTMNEILPFPDVNRRPAGEICGFDIAYGYDMAVPRNLPARLAPDKRVPDVDLVIDKQPATLYACMEKGGWVHLAAASQKQGVSALPEWLDPHGVKHITADCIHDSPSFTCISSALIRPDGYVQ
ncbi:hypothetical protein LV564_08505 [Komagataeibacter nataicola]|uniref:aromatic-ring hydroxylase C-terminal domain-containing protein n=1 Tax=Komagataeibacter nataicola TaxID=265960 RepID=UPI0011B4ECE2|nr:hypothetical protein [Komagataeibacter nataicola]WEQ57079.1 hypothetical protein LV564_08505 [Komagataeibacter nataicola]WNM08615.1 hypothetical protein RI056_17650 [Komagataeibacter nataicola]